MIITIRKAVTPLGPGEMGLGEGKHHEDGGLLSRRKALQVLPAAVFCSRREITLWPHLGLNFVA
jgi:hypothetical protein